MATIEGVYLALFGRPADPFGLQFYNGQSNNGQNLNGIRSVQSSDEFQGRFEGQSNLQIITSVYQSLFNREPDFAGLTFFAAELAAGRQTVNTIAINILDGAQGSDLTILNTKLATANAFTAAIDTKAEIIAYAGMAAAKSAASFIQTISTTASTQAQINAAVAATTDSFQTPIGTVLTLTTATGERIAGTAGDDTTFADGDGLVQLTGVHVSDLTAQSLIV